jgi:subtilisin family serine protease
VDVVLIEASFPPQDGDHLKDGRSVLGTLMSRLSRRYSKPSFWTANNDPSMSSIVDPSIAPETISVGAYDSSESMHVHFGMKLPWRDALHQVGSEGPAGNGAAKPDLLAPSMMIGPRDGYLDSDAINSLPGLYQLPGGYMVSGGTSAATPIASGAAAVLVSAAKQSGLPHDAASIKHALVTSARYLANAGSYQQGAGLMRVGAAWEQLKSQAEAKPLVVDVRAPVNTASSHLLAPPNQGAGLFEREGWRAGQSGVRRVTLTRRNGPAGVLRFATRWQGNRDGAFSVAPGVELPLNKPVEVQVAIALKAEGVYSATL